MRVTFAQLDPIPINRLLGGSSERDIGNGAYLDLLKIGKYLVS